MPVEINVVGDLHRLNLKPGDKLVFTTPMHVSPELAAEVRDAVAKTLPGYEVIILSDGLKLEVLEAA